MKRRKQKPATKKKREPIQPWLEFLSKEIQYLRGEIHSLRLLVSDLVLKLDRQYASAIGISMENARLRDATEAAAKINKIDK